LSGLLSAEKIITCVGLYLTINLFISFLFISNLFKLFEFFEYLDANFIFLRNLEKKIFPILLDAPITIYLLLDNFYIKYF